LEQYFHICGSPADPEAGVILLECESSSLRAETPEDDPTPTWTLPAPSDLFDLLESKPVWSIEELAEVLTVSPKTLYKQAKRGNFPSFRIGSCVRVHGKGLADHLRSRMKK
jgi:excisionase family DNA binding protein